MKKLMWVILAVIALIIYLNIGYILAYSLDSNPNVPQTAFSTAVYNIFDFYGVMGKPSTMGDIEYILISLIWLLLLVVSWILNSAVILWKVFVWLFSGGIFRWLGLIK